MISLRLKAKLRSSRSTAEPERPSADFRATMHSDKDTLHAAPRATTMKMTWRKGSLFSVRAAPHHITSTVWVQEARANISLRKSAKETLSYSAGAALV